MGRRQTLAAVIRKVENAAPLQGEVQKTKAQYEPHTGKVTLCFEPTSHRLPADFLSIRTTLGQCGSGDVRVRVSQEGFAGALRSDKALLSKCIKDCCVLSQPAVLPFITPAHVGFAENTVTVSMQLKEAAEIFSGLGMRESIKEYMSETYGLDVRVEVGTTETESDDVYEPPQAVRDMKASEIESATQVPWRPADDSVPSTEPKKTPARKSAPLVLVSELETGKCATIDVRVVSADSRKARNGELTIHSMCVSDGTSSVSTILFESEKRPLPGPVPGPGTWTRLTGKLEDDSYSGEPVFKISDIQPSKHIDRMDTAQEKRVELHAHTKMSAMDAVTGIRDLVERAAAWGHDAVAITDHGVTQAFPAAAAAAGDKIKLIYGVEAYMFDDTTSPWSGAEDCGFDQDFVVFDLETTGLSALNAHIIEIGAVRVSGGKMTDTFQTYVASPMSVPPAVTQLTGITDEKLMGAPSLEEAICSFKDFAGDTALVAHNAPFDIGFLNLASKRSGVTFSEDMLDTLRLVQICFPNFRSHKLSQVGLQLGLPPFDAHRADNDAAAAAQVMLVCFDDLRKKGVATLGGVRSLMTPESLCHGAKTYHIILLCKDKQGMTDLNRLISRSHIEFLDRKKPRMPRSDIERWRDHLIVGSACESGELYQAMLLGEAGAQLENRAKFYDYLEIQPVGNNRFMTRTGQLANEDAIRELNSQIVSLGNRIGRPVAATCDVHFLDPEDECFRRILQGSMGFENAEQPPLFLRTTDEMLAEFAYLGHEKAREVVIEVPRRLAEKVERFELLPGETMMPIIDDAAEEIERMAYENAHQLYGDPLPEIVEQRLKRELGSIIGHGFSVLYYSAHKLVRKSNEDGYLVGSRGSVGSSLTATMTGITEVNPLPPHYVCPSCCHSDFDVDSAYDCGADLPDAACPLCGAPYRKEGFNIPFEVFLGIDADKVPDIDLNFSGEYQNRAHKYTEELFGRGHVFRAGTITGLQAKNAYGYVKHYAEDTAQKLNNAEIARLQSGLQGVKKTTGQHPGGMVIVPRGHEIYEFTAVQWPANEAGADFVTTHFDFRSMHDVLVKLDILGHDAPTIMRLVQDLTGVDPLEIPIADPEVLRLFSTIEPLGIKPEDLFGITKGTLGVPEFGTSFVRKMLEDTKPTTVSEIIRICGLSHGTGVWLGNAQELIKDGTCTLSEAICARDDIMNYLVARGADKRQAFFLMEKTRKGKVAKNGFSESEQELLESANVPQWFTDACRKIEYLFPKGHAVAYCLMSLRIAYCKVYHKEAFYATYFDVNTDKFDATLVSDGLAGIRRRHESIMQKGNAVTDTDRTTAVLLEVCAEMYLRGTEFLRVDLEKSDPFRFTIEEEGIRMPLIAVPQLGDKVAQAIAHERTVAPFLSIEDLRRRTKLSSSVAEAMKETGALARLASRDQLSLFDLH